MRESLLVNLVYCHPVGHAVEALHYAHGYHRADPDLRIAVALIDTTATDLAALCPFVEALYTVPVDVFDGEADYDQVLADIPSTWDYVVDDDRGHQPLQRAIFPGLAAYYDAASRHFAGKRGSAGVEPPNYAAGEALRLVIPEEPRARAEERLGEGAPRVAILPGGSSPRLHYPSVRSWTTIIAALALRFPDAMFCLTGKLRADGRTTTTFDRAELHALRAAMPRAIEVVDEPLIDQLATMQACDVLISPHTGFGMATLATGTPWLAIAGNKWPEWYFNGVPFYSVLPDTTRFPCYTMMSADPPLVDDDGPRTPSMTLDRIRADLDEIVDATARLVERRWPYEQALADHFTRLPRILDPNLIFSIDHIHRAHLPASP